MSHFHNGHLLKNLNGRPIWLRPYGTHFFLFIQARFLNGKCVAYWSLFFQKSSSPQVRYKFQRLFVLFTFLPVCSFAVIYWWTLGQQGKNLFGSIKRIKLKLDQTKLNQIKRPDLKTKSILPLWKEKSKKTHYWTERYIRKTLEGFPYLSQNISQLVDLSFLFGFLYFQSRSQRNIVH